MYAVDECLKIQFGNTEQHFEQLAINKTSWEINEVNNEQIKVSIIIPTYKRNERLGNAIDSCLNQSYKEIEVVIVDDNGFGTEHQLKTKNKIEKIIERVGNQRIRYIANDRNMGGAEARNVGVKSSTGNYIAFLDDDDLLHKDSVKFRLSAIQQYGVDFCVSDMNIIDANGDIVDCNSCEFRGLNLVDFMLGGNFYTPMLLIKREKFLKVGGFIDTPRFQDYLLMIKLLSSEIHFYHLKQRLFDHIRHDDERISSSKSKNFENGWIARIECENKYLHLLNHSQILKIKFRWYDNMAISALIGGKKTNAIKYIFKMANNIYALSCIKRIGILVTRLVVARKIHEKLRVALKGY